MFKKTFKRNKNILIGAIHLPPLFGYPDAPSVRVAIANALKDLAALEKGGVDAVIFENNYDLPHKTKIDKEAFLEMVIVGQKIKEATNLPVGVSVLWNDFESAFALANMLGLQFIRVPVFVDDVKTTYGKMAAAADSVAAFRKKVDVGKVMVFADIHVKHATILSKRSIEESAKLAMKKGADAVIVTGKWTGDAPDVNELARVRKAVGIFPILIGSGVDDLNVRDLFMHANGAIVSTSLKKGARDASLTNVKRYEKRVDVERVKKLKKRIS